MDPMIYKKKTKQNANLETLVVLEELLSRTGGLVVHLTDHARVEHTAGGIEGVHGRVDAQLRDLTGKHLSPHAPNTQR